jgi:hypothetical protein
MRTGFGGGLPRCRRRAVRCCPEEGRPVAEPYRFGTGAVDCKHKAEVSHSQHPEHDASMASESGARVVAGPGEALEGIAQPSQPHGMNGLAIY